MGAILNATFGSMVEVILFIIMLKKGKDSDQECYQELVKSSLTGLYVGVATIHCSIVVSTLQCGLEDHGTDYHHAVMHVIYDFCFYSPD